MGILGSNDVEMEDSTAPTKRKNKKDVKSLVKNSAVSLQVKNAKQKKEKNKTAVLSEKKKEMSQLKVLKNQLWMRVVKELKGRTNLIPIHQEILAKIVGRTCLPQHKDRFTTFVEKSLKIDKEKYGKSIEELFMMLKKNFKKQVQTAGLQKAAAAAVKAKVDVSNEKPKKKVGDRSHLTKSQRKRQRRTERQKLARARDGVLKPSKKKGKQSNLSGSKKSISPKVGIKKVHVQKIKKPRK